MTTSLSNDETGSGNRISPRHMFETRIRIRLQRESRTLTLQGWVRNLSESGLGAFVAEALTLGESVTLEIPLPDSDKLVIPANVVRALGTEYGFQFTALSAEQRTRIRAALKGQPAIPYPGTGRCLPAAKQETTRYADTAFAERARMLIKRGYTPRVAVELALHEMEFEHGNDPRMMEKSRADAEDFLLKVGKGLI